MQRFVEAEINYQGEMAGRPAYYATDYSRDRLALQANRVRIHDLRAERDGLSLDREGFMLVDHKTTVTDFRDDDQITRVYHPEIAQLVQRLTGADRVLMAPHGVLRFSEKSADYGSRTNTRPARFVHVDSTHNALPLLLNPLLQAAHPPVPPGRRYFSFNAWRVLTPPPQDVPLTVCDIRTLAEDDLVPADAIFDAPGAPEWSFEGYLIRYNPKHRWCYFSGMTPDEVLIFRSYDSEEHPLGCVAHVAFDDPTCPPSAPPRASIEVRGYAFFND
jgi:hypothetical protein